MEFSEITILLFFITKEGLLRRDGEYCSNYYVYNCFVIAVDSVVGTVDLINTIVVREGSLLPGVGLGNSLPPIGDCSIMGVTVDKDRPIETSLTYSNLHIIYKMATNIAKGISLAVRLYFKYPSSHPVLV